MRSEVRSLGPNRLSQSGSARCASPLCLAMSFEPEEVDFSADSGVNPLTPPPLRPASVVQTAAGRAFKLVVKDKGAMGEQVSLQMKPVQAAVAAGGAEGELGQTRTNRHLPRQAPGIANAEARLPPPPPKKKINKRTILEPSATQ